MKRSIQRRLQREKEQIARRLAPFVGGTRPRNAGRPELNGAGIVYEMSGRTRALSYGGIGVIHRMVHQLGLQRRLDQELGILKRARPYQDSDHVLNIAYNVNRSGNRPSYEGAPTALDQAIDLCHRAGFKDILLRGDTDFTMTQHLDRWNAIGVRFVFGYDARRGFVDRANNIPDGEYVEMVRKADLAFDDTKRRSQQPRVKEEIVYERQYLNKRLISEDLAEFEHKPNEAKGSYRVVVLRKLINEERGQRCLNTYYRYFFYVTNDRSLSRHEVVAESNQRCNQENLIEQLKNGVRSLHAPLNTLDANWAYMAIASLAWSLKAWFALLLPVAPRKRKAHEEDRQALLRMDFRTFLDHLILIPAQIVRTGRRTVFRLLAWRRRIELLFRLLQAT